MAYCWKCGAQLYENSSFCQKCGAPAKPTPTAASAPSGQTAFERLRDDRGLQDHWARRVIAYVIDVVIVSVALFILALAIAAPALPGILFGQTFPSAWFWGFWFGGLSPLIVLAYFVFAEGLFARTIGKELMGLRVVRIDTRRLDLWSALVRNISKIAFILLVIDLAVGLGTHGDGYQKYSDQYIGTTVEATSSHRIIPEHI
jgi:uncharacterized RDD family membrane protein YckC